MDIEALASPLSIRAFFAINLSEETTFGITQFVETLKIRFSDLNIHWYPPEKLHITLRFLGYLPSLQIPELIDKTQAIFQQQKPFTLKFKQIALFPPKHHPHTVVLIPQPITPLRTLVESLEKPILTLGLKAEQRKYQAHLTLGKIKSTQLPDLTQIKVPPIPKLCVKSCHLLKSTPHQHTTAYTIMHIFHF